MRNDMQCGQRKCRLLHVLRRQYCSILNDVYKNDLEWKDDNLTGLLAVMK
jgi:hypothetical protein